MNTSVLASSLLQKLDRIKPDLKPLPTHYIASQDTHTRELYATMLAAVLLSKGQVSEPETRLFGMLLQSMQLDATTAKFFELAQQWDARHLKQLIQALHRENQQCALLLDILILARLDQPLSQVQTALVAEIFDCFTLPLDTVTQLVAVTSMALGLPNGLQNAVKKIILSERLCHLSPVTDVQCADEMSGQLLQAGVYHDQQTGLMWMRHRIGQTWENNMAHGNAKDYRSDQSKAKIDIDQMNQQGGFAESNDWRLPSMQELNSLKNQSGDGYATPEGILCHSNGEFISSSSEAMCFSHDIFFDMWGRSVFARAVRGVSQKQLDAPSVSNRRS